MGACRRGRRSVFRVCRPDDCRRGQDPGRRLLYGRDTPLAHPARRSVGGQYAAPRRMDWDRRDSSFYHEDARAPGEIHDDISALHFDAISDSSTVPAHDNMRHRTHGRPRPHHRRCRRRRFRRRDGGCWSGSWRRGGRRRSGCRGWRGRRRASRVAARDLWHRFWRRRRGRGPAWRRAQRPGATERGGSGGGGRVAGGAGAGGLRRNQLDFGLGFGFGFGFGFGAGAGRARGGTGRVAPASRRRRWRAAAARELARAQARRRPARARAPARAPPAAGVAVVFVFKELPSLASRTSIAT